MYIPEVTVCFCEKACQDANVNYSPALTDSDAFLGETVTRGGGFAGQINGRRRLVVGHPKERCRCQAADGESPACRAWKSRRSALQAAGEDLSGEVDRMLRFLLEHDMGHVLGLSHYPGVMNKSIRAGDSPARLCVKDGGRLVALTVFNLSRQTVRSGAEFLRSSLKSAFSVPALPLR